jgi:predicted RNA polymerase sigma factor
LCVNRGGGSVAPDFRVTTWALCIDPPFAKLIRGSWFAKVVVMSERSTEQIRELLDSLYRVDSGRILATLIRLLGDFDLAEEAMHEAFAAALSLWPRSGVPVSPRPWLISTARFKAIDTLRRRARFDASQDELARYLEAQSSSAEGSNEEDSLEDVQLNRAVAIAMCEGPEAGLAHIDAVLEQGELANYYLAHSARADMYRRLGRTVEARSSYEKALALTQQEPERQFLQERIRQLK